MSIDIKLSIAQITKAIQSGGSFGSWLANLGKKTLTKVAIPLARDNLPGFVASNAINKFEKNLLEKELWEQKKDLIHLFWMKLLMIL